MGGNHASLKEVKKISSPSVFAISAYLFIVALEFLFTLIKKQQLIKDTEIFDNCFMFSAYADDSTDADAFFLVYIFQIFWQFSGVKPNISKCEIADIGLL